MVTAQKAMVSARGREAPPSPIRKLSPLAEVAKSEGVHVHHLNIGQPDLPAPQLLLDGLRNFKGPVLPYAPSPGIPETLDAWQAYYRHVGLEFERGELLVTTGGSEAVMFSMMAVADPGDEIITIEPGYANYFGFARLGAISVLPVRARPEDGYHLPASNAIESVITPRTKAIMFSSPSNPTGTVYSYDELKVLSDIASRHGLFLIADETYREIVFHGDRDMSMLKVEDTVQQTIIVDSVSKRFSATGARVGCIASHNPEVMDAVTRFAQARLSSPTVEQLAVIPLLRDPRPHTDPLGGIYGSRCDVVYEALGRIPGVQVRKPEGAFYIFAVLPVDDGDRFASWLLTDYRYEGETVMIAPGAGFYFTSGLGAGEARIAFVLEEESLKRAMTILGEALQAYPGLQRS